MSAFQDKVVLVTGATSGIGKVTAIAFAREGAKVVVSGRREKEGLETVRTIKECGGEARFVSCDISRESEVRHLVDAAAGAHGRLDIAFNNAGIEWKGPLTEVEEADYRRTFDTNVWGVITCMKYEIPVMLKSGGGAIVNTSSIAGHIGMAGVSLYIASKHAVEGLTRAAALEFAKRGIRINSVAPAAIETDMVDRFAGKEGPQREYLMNLHPIGRGGEPNEVADAVLFLCSDKASFITGTSLMVDGGFTAQ